MHSLERLLDQAQNLLQLGRVDNAIDTLRQLLAQAPDLAEAHALLAHCLAAQKRLGAARHEAGLALAAEPDLAMAHHAMAVILMASRKLKEAEHHVDFLLEQMPEDAGVYLLRARLQSLQNRKSQVFKCLEKARSLEPENIEVTVDLGEYYLEMGELDKAWQFANQALEREPEYQDALILMGYIQLKQGNLDEATQSAHWALRQDPTDAGAIRLLASLKARRNPFLGLWWRYNAKMSEFGETGSIVILLGVFFLYRILAVYVAQIGRDDFSGPLNLLWLGLCVYTWVGPQLFRRSLHKEMKTVLLRDDF